MQKGIHIYNGSKRTNRSLYDLNRVREFIVLDDNKPIIVTCRGSKTSNIFGNTSNIFGYTLYLKLPFLLILSFIKLACKEILNISFRPLSVETAKSGEAFPVWLIMSTNKIFDFGMVPAYLRLIQFDKVIGSGDHYGTLFSNDFWWSGHIKIFGYSGDQFISVNDQRYIMRIFDDFWSDHLTNFWFIADLS